MDWNKATEELRKPLNAKHVFERKQGGRDVSYVEAWRAIDEANRIFGFNGWSSQTEFQLVSEKPRKIGQQQKDGWGVSYIAKVRVTVDGLPREGVGAGHGIDVDLGQAHESALKEAESDARKRALMTFGNPFGLALYDKTQANVADEAPAAPKHTSGNGHSPAPVTASENYTRLIEELPHINTLKGLDTWGTAVATADQQGVLNGHELNALREVYSVRKAEIAVSAG